MAGVKLEKGEWKAPAGASTELAPPGAFERPEDSARVDFGLAGARVHTFEAKGPLAFVLAMVVLLAVGAIFTLVFVFAVGAGVALAAGAAFAAALGVGATRVGRMLASGRRRELDESRRER